MNVKKPCSLADTNSLLNATVFCMCTVYFNEKKNRCLKHKHDLHHIDMHPPNTHTLAIRGLVRLVQGSMLSWQCKKIHVSIASLLMQRKKDRKGIIPHPENVSAQPGVLQHRAPRASTVRNNFVVVSTSEEFWCSGTPQRVEAGASTSSRRIRGRLCSKWDGICFITFTGWRLEDELLVSSREEWNEFSFTINNSLSERTISEAGRAHSFHQCMTNLAACQNSRLLLRKRLFCLLWRICFPTSYTLQNHQKFPPHTHTHLPAHKTLLLPTRWHTHRQRCTRAHTTTYKHTPVFTSISTMEAYIRESGRLGAISGREKMCVVIVCIWIWVLGVCVCV